MASPTISYLQQFVNLLVGQGEVAAKRVDATYINAFGTDICRSIAERMSNGDKAVDAGSGINQTIITLYSDSNRTSQIKAGDWFEVTELATGSVWTGTCSVDDVISFSTNGVGVDGQLMSGAAPADYSAAAFIDDLRIEIRHQLHHEIQVQEINRTDGDVGALQTDNLLRPGGAVLETDLTALENAFNTDHVLATGDHRAEVIDNPTLNVDAFAPDAWTYEGIENLINGDFEEDDDGDGVVNGWAPYLAPPTVNLSAVQVKRGTLSQLVTTLGAGPGIHAYADYRLHTLAGDFQSMEVSFAILVYDAGGGGTVTVEINDGVGTTNATGGTAGAWDIVYVTRTMNAAATTCEVRVYAAAATTFYVAGAICKFGRLNFGYINAPAETAERLFKRSIHDNYFANGDFKDWTNNLPAPAVVPPPDWWTATVGVPVFAQNAVTFLFGQYAMDVTFALGDAIQITTLQGLDFALPIPFANQYAIISFYYYGVGVGSSLQVQVTDGVAVTTSTIAPIVGQWLRYSMAFPVSGASVAQTLTITGLAPSQVIFDGVMLHRGYIPETFKASASLQRYKSDFVMAGAIAPTNMTFHGSLLEAILPSDCYIHKIMVYSTVAPGGVVVDTYDVLQNGAVTGLAATVTGAATVGATHTAVPIFYNQNDRLQIAVTPGGGTAAMDVSAVVEGIMIGN